MATNNVYKGSAPENKTAMKSASDAKGIIVADSKQPMNNPQYVNSKSTYFLVYRERYELSTE